MKAPLLIDASQLHQQMDNPNSIIIDCRFDLNNPDAGYPLYQAAHIPNARYAHLDHDLSSPITPNTGRHPLPTPENFNRALSQLGITPESNVILYDQANNLFSSRFWWLLRAIGHKNIQLLNGGIADYAKRFPLNDQPVEYRASLYPLKSFTEMEIFDSHAVESAIKKAEICLIDVRTSDRYRGENEHIDPIAGHIPTALNLSFIDNLDENEKFLSAEKLRQNFAPFIEQKRPLVFYCGSGVTSCHTRLALELSGLTPKSAIYPGSWSEWIRDPNHANAIK